jgi:hypothetical protein
MFFHELREHREFSQRGFYVSTVLISIKVYYYYRFGKTKTGNRTVSSNSTLGTSSSSRVDLTVKQKQAVH